MNGYNFTERVRKVLAMAREEATRLHHDYLGTEHILLGLIREGEGVAAAVLQSLTVDLEQIQQKVEELVKKGKPQSNRGPDLPYTSRAKKVLELAMSEARELNHSYVGTEHLLLGLLREEKGIAAQVLTGANVTLETARVEVLRLLGDEVGRKPPTRPLKRESPTEMLRASIADFGPALGPVYQSLRSELAWLYVKWDQYIALYGRNEERLDLLNDVAPLFFRIAQSALWDDIVAHLGRLSTELDPADRSQVTIRGLPGLIEDAGLKAEIARLVEVAVKQTEGARERHVRPANEDLAVMLMGRAQSYRPAAGRSVHDALVSIETILNRLSARYRNSTTTFDIGDYPNGVLALVYALREGRDARRLRHQQIEDAERKRDETDRPPPP